MAWIRTEVPIMHGVAERLDANHFLTKCGKDLRPILAVDSPPPQFPTCEACSAAEGSVGSGHDDVPVEEADDR